MCRGSEAAVEIVFTAKKERKTCATRRCVFFANITILDIRAIKRMADLLITVLRTLRSASQSLLITLLYRQLPYFVPD